MNPNRRSMVEISKDMKEIIDRKPTKEQLEELAKVLAENSLPPNLLRNKLAIKLSQTYLDHLEVFGKMDVEVLSQNMIDTFSEFVYNENCGDLLVQEFVNLLEEDSE